jgi:hypothetical protein
MSTVTQPDLLRPIIEAVKNELRAELLAELRAESLACSAERAPSRIMLSIADTSQRYGIGRIALNAMIKTGRLRAVERICRGGRVGQFLHLADCERILAGRKAVS